MLTSARAKNADCRNPVKFKSTLCLQGSPFQYFEIRLELQYYMRMNFKDGPSSVAYY